MGAERPFRVERALFGLVLAATGIPAAEAAHPVRTLTAAEPDRPLPELHLGVGYRRIEKRGQITREWFDGAGAVDVRELAFEEVAHLLELKARVGLYHHLELRLTAPLVLAYDSRLRFADGVGPGSTVYAPASEGRPATNADDPDFATRFPITAVPSSRERAGFGDLRVGIAWSPLEEARDPGYPTLTLLAELTVPTGEIWDPSDIEALPGGSGGDVGRGLTVLDLELGLSKRARPGAPTFDPYVVFGAKVPVAARDGIERGIEAPASGRVTAGAELVMAEAPADGTRYAVDLAVLMRFIGAGRTYSPLSDYLPRFDSTLVDGPVEGYDDYADPDHYRNQGPDGVSCSGVRLDRTTGAQVPAIPGVPCGELNQVEEHLHLGGRLAFHLQPSRWFLLRFGAEIAFVTEHLLTNESAGTDTDRPSDPATCGGGPCFGRVNASNARGQDERNPFYDPRYDAPGRRFSFEDAFTWTAFGELVLTF